MTGVVKTGDLVFWDDPGGRVAHVVRDPSARPSARGEVCEIIMFCGAKYEAHELRRATAGDAPCVRCGTAGL